MGCGWVLTSWRRRRHSPVPCSRSTPACRAPAPGERHGQQPRGHSSHLPPAPEPGFLTYDISCGRSPRLRGRGALEMLPLVPISFTVGQTGLGMELPSLALLGIPLAAPGPAGPWGQSWSPGWPYRGHLDCGLAGAEGSLRLKASTGMCLPLFLPPLGRQAGTTRPPYVLCPGARMPLCPRGGSAQGVPSLCCPPGCPSAETLLLDLFPQPPSVALPSTKLPSQGWALRGVAQAAAPARGPAGWACRPQRPAMGTEQLSADSVQAGGSWGVPW